MNEAPYRSFACCKLELTHGHSELARISRDCVQMRIEESESRVVGRRRTQSAQKIVNEVEEVYKQCLVSVCSTK